LDEDVHRVAKRYKLFLIKVSNVEAALQQIPKHVCCK